MRDAALARAHQGCSVASLAWSCGGALYVTIVVKATLALRDGAVAALITPAPVEVRDRFAGREHASSLVAARELFPYRPRVDVTLTGHATLPAGGTGLVRLAVVGDGGWIDKTLEVRRHEAAAVMGALAPSAARRRAALDGADPRFLDDEAPRFPEGFDWEHFQAAPEDQQLAWLAGTETIELHGLVDGCPQIHTRLPGLAAAAWAFAPWEVAEGQPVDLVADGLVIDADRALAHVVWRGTYPLLGDDWSLSQLQLVASVTAAETASEPAPSRPPPQREVAPAAPIDVPSLFDTDDGEDHGTKPLTRKELLAAMAAAGKALPFGAPRRREANRTAELELPEATEGRPVPPASPASPSSPGGAEVTRKLALERVFSAGSDDHTMAGDDAELGVVAVDALPPWLRAAPAPRRDTEVDPEERSPSISDDETHVDDVPPRR